MPPTRIELVTVFYKKTVLPLKLWRLETQPVYHTISILL